MLTIRSRWLLPAALLVACDAPTIPERVSTEFYDYRLLTPEPRVLRWPLGSTVRVFMQPDTDPAARDALEAALASAVRVWNSAALYGEVRLERATALEQADVLLLYSNTPLPVDVSHCQPSGNLAYTTFCLHPEVDDRLAVFPILGASGQGSIKFLVTVRSQSVLNAENVRRLVAHELGHVLGIAQHSPNAADLLHATNIATAEPSPADRATLQVLYQSRADITP